MWRVILFTKLHLEKLEEKLSMMEEKGYKLDSFMFCYFFCFKASKEKKDIGYRVHVLYAKMFDSNLYDIESKFAKRYYANPIAEKHSLLLCYPVIWRCQKIDDALFKKELNLARDRVIQRIVYWQLLGTIMLFTVTLCLLYYQLRTNSPLLIVLLCSILCLILIAYRTYEMIVLKKRIRNIL